MTAPRRHLLPWISLLVVYVVWGSTYLAIRIVVREMPPLAAGALRFFTAGLVMAGVAAFADRKHGRPTRRQLADYAFVGVLLLAVGNGCVMWAERTIPSGIAALIVATVPLWIVLLDGLRPGGQPWTGRVWVGTLIGLIGVAFVARPQGGISPDHVAGIVALQAGALSWTIGSLYVQSRPQKLPLFTASAVEMLAGAVMLGLESLAFREDWSRFSSASATAWASDRLPVRLRLARGLHGLRLLPQRAAGQHGGDVRLRQSRRRGGPGRAHPARAAFPQPAHRRGSHRRLGRDDDAPASAIRAVDSGL